MNTKLILSFLKDVAENNNRPWFQEHRSEYLAAKDDFEQGVAKAIGTIAEFDPSIAHISVQDASYRFYRDTRFSPDNSPYKRHLGAYIAAHGKRHYMVVITFTSNLATVCWRVAVTVFPHKY